MITTGRKKMEITMYRGLILSITCTHAMLAALRHHGHSVGHVPCQAETHFCSWLFNAPENIPTTTPLPPPHTNMFLGVSISNPAGNSSFCSYFPSPLEFPTTLFRVGRNIFWKLPKR